jgi:hypothetical protein
MELRCPTCNQEIPWELQLSYSTPITAIKMSTRLRRTLMNEGIVTIGEATRILTARIPNFGIKSQMELAFILGLASPATYSGL